MAALTDRAMLVTLNISQWMGRRLDKEQSEDVTYRTKSVRGAARVHKDLLPGAIALQKVHKQAGEIRTFLYKRTLPWAEGVQILRSEGYLQFQTDMGQLRREYERLVIGFISEYPQLIKHAKTSLGKMFNEDDYPDAADLQDKFKIEVQFMPIPAASDWRVTLDDEHIKALQEGVEAQVKQASSAAMRVVYDRIFDVVKKAHERLADPKAVFRNSLVENAVELCDLLPSLNLTGDKKVDQLRREIMGSLGKHNPDTLRKDKHARAKTAAKLDDVMRKMSTLYGAAK